MGSDMVVFVDPAIDCGLGLAVYSDNTITAKRMISGLVLKYLNGECFVIRPGYETARPVSS
jgi:hypothetical protein